MEMSPVSDEEGQQRHHHLAGGPEDVDQVAHQGLVAGAGDLHRQDAHAHEGPQGPEPREHADYKEGGVVRHEGGDQSADRGDEHREEHHLLPAEPV